MTAYAIHAQILTHVSGYDGSVSVPTFYLLSDVQGITDADHAARVASCIIDPLHTIPADSLRVTAYAVDLERELTEVAPTKPLAPFSEYSYARFGFTFARHARRSRHDFTMTRRQRP